MGNRNRFATHWQMEERRQSVNGMQSVNVMQVDLPAEFADRERVLELLRKHDVVLPAVDKRANQNLGMVEAGDEAVEIYYILATMNSGRG